MIKKKSLFFDSEKCCGLEKCLMNAKSTKIISKTIFDFSDSFEILLVHLEIYFIYKKQNF